VPAHRHETAAHIASTRCSQAILGFLSTTDAGRGVGLERLEEDAQSEVSEAQLRERELREEGKRLDADEQGGVMGVIVRYLASLGGQAGGQGELQRATCGLIEVGVAGTRAKKYAAIVGMGCMRV